MAQYYNLYLAGEEDREFPLNGIFDIASKTSPVGHIFAMNKEPIEPFTSQEICLSHTIDANAGMRPTKLFQLSSHTHQWGVQFRIWQAPNLPCEVWQKDICKPGPDERLIYTSRSYTDPVELTFDPPIFYEADKPWARTLRYCSVFDNGSTDDSPEVHRLGTSAGTCQVRRRACIHGPLRGEDCEIDGDCDSAPSAGDGVCDGVCPVRGGFTTTDEMFILLGSYYIDDTPIEETTSAAEPASTQMPQPPPQSAAFCGLIGIELLWLWPAARWLRRASRERRAHVQQ
jgi:hypothetical protein